MRSSCRISGSAVETGVFGIATSLNNERVDSIVSDSENECIPFLKWVGGKSRFVREIGRFVPRNFNNYYEPFLGSGVVFCAYGKEKRAFLSDVNEELINAFVQVRDNCGKLVRCLAEFENTEEEYYRIRSEVFTSKIRRAARFIFLNKTSYNGVFRVNRRGYFNVPYGHNPGAPFYHAEKLRRLSKVLRANVTLTSIDFEEALSDVKKGDFVFIDPPYTVSHGNNGFIEYNKKLFSWEDQKRLADCTERLARKGAYFVLTNAKHPSILALYRNTGNYFELTRQNGITSVIDRRGTTTEYLFTNYR